MVRSILSAAMISAIFEQLKTLQNMWQFTNYFRPWRSHEKTHEKIVKKSLLPIQQNFIQHSFNDLQIKETFVSLETSISWKKIYSLEAAY